MDARAFGMPVKLLLKASAMSFSFFIIASPFLQTNCICCLAFTEAATRIFLWKRHSWEFHKFTRKHPCQSLFFNKVGGFCEISKNTFFTEHLRTTLLCVCHLAFVWESWLHSFPKRFVIIDLITSGSRRPEVFCRNGVLRNFPKFRIIHRKTPVTESLF